MTTPYIGEIRMFGGIFAPAGWALCNGQVLPIAENTPLFTLIGTIYGGDGQTTFALPNLQSRVAVHTAAGFPMGSIGGTETVTLTGTQYPIHPHSFLASVSSGTQRTPVNNTTAAPTGGRAYLQAVPDVQLNAQSIGSDGGGGQPHSNIQFYQCISFIISLFGIYPTPT